MNNASKKIIIIESSNIIYEGLISVLTKKNKNYSFYRLFSLDEIFKLHLENKTAIVIINPIIIQNKLNEFIKLKIKINKVHWIGIINNFFASEILNNLDDYFFITDNIEIIQKKINKIFKLPSTNDNKYQNLTTREIDVLKLLAKGLSNKEIAENLNISIHTVITHRKNIMEKTDIRSLPGLTIYAVSKKLITID